MIISEHETSYDRGFPYNILNLSMSSTSFEELSCVLYLSTWTQFTIRSIKINAFFVCRSFVHSLALFPSRGSTTCVRETCREMILQINDEKFIAFLFRIECLITSLKGLCKRNKSSAFLMKLRFILESFDHLLCWKFGWNTRQNRKKHKTFMYKALKLLKLIKV